MFHNHQRLIDVRLVMICHIYLVQIMNIVDKVSIVQWFSGGVRMGVSSTEMRRKLHGPDCTFISVTFMYKVSALTCYVSGDFMKYFV